MPTRCQVPSRRFIEHWPNSSGISLKHQGAAGFRAKVIAVTIKGPDRRFATFSFFAFDEGTWHRLIPSLARSPHGKIRPGSPIGRSVTALKKERYRVSSPARTKSLACTIQEGWAYACRTHCTDRKTSRKLERKHRNQRRKIKPDNFLHPESIDNSIS